MFEKARVFVAGGRTGFLGTNMVKALLNRKAVVYAASRDGQKTSFFPLDTTNLIQVSGDLCVAANIPPGIDYVFHCAAHTSGAHEMVHDPVAQILPNLAMNTNMLDAAARNKVKKFIFISSSAVYPDMDEPMREEKAFDGDPPDSYFGPAWMKRFAEKLAEFYYRRYGMEVLIIRPSNVYGPYCSFDLERSHVLPALIRKFVERQDPIEVWGTPDVVRDFIFADDFVRGVLTACEKTSGYEIVNIASGNLYTIGEAVETIKDLTDYKGKYSFNASKPMTIRKRMIDTSKAARLLDFHATTTFRDGLKKTIDWYVSTLKSGG
jgi:GDP-L-fucose synthase